WLRRLAARTDDFDFYATVLGAAFARGVAGHGLELTLAFGVDAVGVDALADQVLLDRVGTALGQTLVVLLGTDGVGVADRDQGFEVDGRSLRGDLVENLTTFGLERVFVEVEEGVGVQDDLGGRGGHDFGLL